MPEESQTDETEIGMSEEELAEEVEELKSDLAERSSAATVRIRGAVAVILVLLVAISITASGVSWWVHYVALDTDAFMEIVEPAITSDEFTDALGSRLSEETIEALDLESRFEDRLSAIDQYIGEQLVSTLDPDPRIIELIKNLDTPRFGDLAGPISAAANDRITEAITGLVSSDEYQAVVVPSVRFAHETAVALAYDGTESFDNLYVDGEDVVWNTLPLVASTLEFVIENGFLDGEDITLPDLSDNPVASVAIARLREALGPHIPDDLGQLVVMGTDDLDTIQGYGRTFDRGLWLLIGLALVLTIGTLVISPRRSRTAIQISVATVIGVVLALIGVREAGNTIQDEILGERGLAAARSILRQLEDSVQAVGWMIILITILVGVLAWFAGRPEQIEKWLDTGRHAVDFDAEPNKVDVFVGRHFDALAVVVVILGLAVSWVTPLTWFSGLLTLAGVGLLVWYGLSARARYELDQAVEEVIEEAVEELEESSEKA
ncbi:MAG: hypothetical protein U9N56_09255 [Actinomycetota bacterium]|nr:hypothetical protein [Actinomycetota bacterium]